MAWLPFAKLEITDGTTTTIDLLNHNSSGFNVTDWQPAIQDLKAGGTWADPPTAGERELIVSQLANVEDQFTFDVNAATPNELIGHLRALRALLEKARQYTTTTWQDTPVYIIAQGYGDSNARYTRVKNWRTPADGFPYGPPMWATIEGNAIEDFQIVIEHGAWSENAPGTGTATEISAVETYDGRNLGNVDDTETRDPTTANEVYVANKRNVANLTDIYTDDGGVWGPNRMDNVLPYRLLPLVPAVGDATYFGIDTTIADSGPFCSLVFDIGTAGAGYTGVWEYWNGGAWVQLSTILNFLYDKTNQDGAMTGAPFDTAGVKSVHWDQPFTWATRNLALDGGPAVTGYFVRMRVTGIPGALTAPTQQNRDVYSIVWPYVEIQSDAVTGDVPATARTIIRTVSSGSQATFKYTNRVVAGLRSYDRGANFSAYINIADEQNPAGITVATVGVLTLFANDPLSPTGRIAHYNPGGVVAMTTEVRLTFNAAIGSEYLGEYRCILRCQRTAGNEGDIGIRIATRNGIGSLNFVSDTQFVDSTNDFEFVDLGAIKLPGYKYNSGNDAQFMMDIQLESTVAAPPDLYLRDLVLIPVDEFAYDTQSSGHDSDVTFGDSAEWDGRYLDFDSITRPKESIVSVVREETNDDIRTGWFTIANGSNMLQSNARQRLWFLSFHYLSGAINLTSKPWDCHTIQISKNQRYWSMRGTD